MGCVCECLRGVQERGHDIANLLEGLGAKRGLSLMFARMKKACNQTSLSLPTHSMSTKLQRNCIAEPRRCTAACPTASLLRGRF